MALIFQLIVVLAVCSAVLVRGSVLGIDFGSEYMKVALVQSGKPFEIVTNMQSKRKTKSCLFFKTVDGAIVERQFGDDAYQFLAKKPDATFCKFNRIIGKTDYSHDKEDDHSLLSSRYYFPYQFINSTDTGRSSYVVTDKISLEPEEMVAMLLEHVKLFATNYGGENIKDVVLTVPSYYTQHERLATIAAAEIADLKVLSLIEENTAAALHYAIDRAHTFETPQNVMFYNMGSDSIQVSIANFSSTTVVESGKNKTTGAFEIIGKGWDDQLGGMDFDMALANWLAVKFHESWHAKKPKNAGKDIQTEPKNSRAMARLKIEAGKLKETLSANDNFPSKIDQLFDDFDLNTKITRQEFEECVQDLLSRLFRPIDDALAMANITKADLHSIELLGGGIRKPKVKELLNKYFEDVNKTCSQHINGDEAMALGATFRGAQLKTTFRVRKIDSSDFNPYSVGVQLKTLPVKETDMAGDDVADVEGAGVGGGVDEQWSKETLLYGSGAKSSSYGKKKTVTVPVPSEKDISCSLFYNSSDPNYAKAPRGTDSTIAMYSVTGISAFSSDIHNKHKEFSILSDGKYNVSSSPKVKLEFWLNTNTGIYTLTSAEVFVDLTPIETVDVSVAGAESESEAGDSEAGAAAKTAAKDDATTTPTPTPPAAAASDEATDSNSTSSSAGTGTNDESSEKDRAAASSSDKTSAGAPKIDIKKKLVPLKKTRQLTITELYGALHPPAWTGAQIAAKRAFIDALDAADKDRRLKDAAMNELETFAYAVKNRLNDDNSLSKISTEEQRDSLLAAVQVELEWLEETGSDAETEVYKDRLATVEKKAGALYTRLSELTDRPAEVKKARSKLNKIRDAVGAWTEVLPQVTEDEKTKLLDLVGKAESWLDEKEEVQSQRKAHEDLAFLSSEIKPTLKSASNLYDKLLKKKPLPPPVTNSTNTTGTNSTNSSDTNSTERVHINPEASEEFESKDDGSSSSSSSGDSDDASLSSGDSANSSSSSESDQQSSVNGDEDEGSSKEKEKNDDDDEL